MDGLSVLTEMKRSDPSLQVIVMTGSQDQATVVEIIRRGADVIVSKPVGFSESFRGFIRFWISADRSRARMAWTDKKMQFDSPGDGPREVSFS